MRPCSPGGSVLPTRMERLLSGTDGHGSVGYRVDADRCWIRPATAGHGRRPPSNANRLRLRQSHSDVGADWRNDSRTRYGERSRFLSASRQAAHLTGDAARCGALAIARRRSPLTVRASHALTCSNVGGAGRTRTCDRGIMSPLQAEVLTSRNAPAGALTCRFAF